MKVFVVVFVAVIMFVGNALVVSIGGSMVAGSQAFALSGHGGDYDFYGLYSRP